MHRELARVPARILLDKGLWPAARVCLSIMYLRLDNRGFCLLTATEIGELMGTTAHTVRRHWGELIDAGYLKFHRIPGVPRETREIRGHYVALTQDGYAHSWTWLENVGTSKPLEQDETA